MNNGDNVNSNSPNTKDISNLLANKIKSKNSLSQDTNSNTATNNEFNKEHKKLSTGLDSLFPSGSTNISNPKDDKGYKGKGLHLLFHLDE